MRKIGYIARNLIKNRQVFVAQGIVDVFPTQRIIIEMLNWSTNNCS